jgi:hypothetical protein
MILPEHVQHNWCMIFGATEVAVIKFGTACFFVYCCSESPLLKISCMLSLLYSLLCFILINISRKY